MGVLQFIRTNMQFFAGGGLFIVTSAYTLPQTVLTSEVKKIYSLYENGDQKPITKHTQDLAQKVLDKMKLTVEAEADVEFFTLCDQDPSYWGSTKMRGRTVIGLPANFDFKTSDNIDKQRIKLGEKSVPWDSETGKKFEQSLLLSDDAKMFAIARQLSYCHSHHVYSNLALICSFSIAGYWAGHACNVLMHLERRTSPATRGLLYTVIGSFSFTLYLMLKDTYNCRLDRKADLGAANLGYAKGGVEYYSKVLQRNQSLRELLGAEGVKRYTLYGNRAAVWRQPQETFTARLDRMKILLVEEENRLNEAKEEITA